MDPTLVGIVHSDEATRLALGERVEGEEGLILAAVGPRLSDIHLPDGPAVIVSGGLALEDPQLTAAKASHVVVTSGSLAEARAALELRAADLVAWPQEAHRLPGALRAAGASLVRENGSPSGRVIGVLGARGGLGTSTIAAWLAMGSSAAALVELDRSGSLANLLVEPEATLERLLEAPGPSAIGELLQEANIGVPVAFGRPFAQEPNAARLKSFVGAMRALGSLVVLDLGRGLGALAAAASECDALLCVVVDEIGCIRALSDRGLVGQPWIRRTFTRRKLLPARDLESALGSAPVAVIEEDPKVARAFDLGGLAAPPKSMSAAIAWAQGTVVAATSSRRRPWERFR